MLSSMRNYRKCLVLIVLFVLCSCLAKASQPIKPVTVCEVLEDLPRYSGKTIAVLGRLASNLIDGAWLTETGCSSVEPSTPIWPHAVFWGAMMTSSQSLCRISCALMSMHSKQRLRDFAKVPCSDTTIKW